MRSKKKILIAGGSHSDIPMIVAAKNLGCYVITSGNKPEELGHVYSDEYHKSDYSDNESMLSLSKELDIDGICACSNDFSYDGKCGYAAFIRDTDKDLLGKELKLWYIP